MKKNFQRNSSQLFVYHSMIDREFLNFSKDYFLLNTENYFDLMLIFLNLINILLNQTIYNQLIDYDQDVMNVNYVKNKMHWIRFV